jgi:hypothetical protein
MKKKVRKKVSHYVAQAGPKLVLKQSSQFSLASRWDFRNVPPCLVNISFLKEETTVQMSITFTVRKTRSRASLS